MMNRTVLFLICALLLFSVTATAAGSESHGAPGAHFAVMTYFQNFHQKRLVNVLIKSIRENGGRYSGCPVYVGIPEKVDFQFEELEGEGVHFVTVPGDRQVTGYPFAFKTVAAAEVEKKAAPEISTLLWLDPGVVVFGDLGDHDTGSGGYSARLRMVSLNNNVGLKKGDPLNGYWGRIFRETGVDSEKVPYKQTVVDRVEVKTYYNCQVYSINPKLGLLQKWKDLLVGLIKDEEYQRKNCTGFTSQVFLHQAVFTALMISEIPESNIGGVPLISNYPVGFHQRLLKNQQVNTLNEIKVGVYDERWLRGDRWYRILPVEGRLRKWLRNTYIDFLRLSENLYHIEGSCNSYLITTREGSVLIDPAGATSTPWGKTSPDWFHEILKKYPLKVIILTHAHPDHWTNTESWAGGKKVIIIAQRKFKEYLEYKDRLTGFFARRNAVFGRKPLPVVPVPLNKTGILPNTFFNKDYMFEIGGLHFELVHTSGESPDHILIKVPELNAVFIGDNYYKYFINNSTFRGTTRRPVSGYLKALRLALDADPEYFLPGHDRPVAGKAVIKREVGKFHDSLKYIHDKTVEGMNLGKDVFALMKEIKLPEDLQIQPFYGKVSWTVRGIYHEYAGWFDEDPASMYSVPVSDVFPEILEAAGGPGKILNRAEELLKEKKYVKVLHLTKMVLSVYSGNERGLKIRLGALKALRNATFNYIERLWLDYGIRQAEERLK